MNVTFEKWHGTGNDFIMVLDVEEKFHPDKTTIEQWCQRKFGIGADGLIIIRPHEAHDFRMVYYNSDGKESTMCGNGGRCAIAFAQKHGLHNGDCSFVAIDGAHAGQVDNGQVHLKMGDVHAVKVVEDAYELDTGSPHYVMFQYPGDEPPIVEQAREIRNSEAYREAGINVNFAKLIGPNSIKVRTYERGVEDETYSCGTGVVASAIATYLHQPKTGKTTYEVKTRGGELKVSFQAEKRSRFNDIWLVGPATFVFRGELSMEE